MENQKVIRRFKKKLGSILFFSISIIFYYMYILCLSIFIVDYPYMLQSIIDLPLAYIYSILLISPIIALIHYLGYKITNFVAISFDNSLYLKDKTIDFDNIISIDYKVLGLKPRFFITNLELIDCYKNKIEILGAPFSLFIHIKKRCLKSKCKTTHILLLVLGIPLILFLLIFLLYVLANF